MNLRNKKCGFLIFAGLLGLLLPSFVSCGVRVDSAAETAVGVDGDAGRYQDNIDEDFNKAVQDFEKQVMLYDYAINNLNSRVGFSVQAEVSEDLDLNLIRSDTGHAIVSRIRSGGSAWYAGVQSGDVILAFNGVSTSQLSATQLADALAGDSGEEISLTIDSNPVKTVQLTRNLIPDQKASIGIGIGIEYAERVDRKPQLAEDGFSFPKTDDQGFPVVAFVLDGKPAARGGIRVGDSITHVDGQSTVGWSITRLTSTIKGEAGETRTLGIKDRKTDVVVELKKLN